MNKLWKYRIFTTILVLYGSTGSMTRNYAVILWTPTKVNWQVWFDKLQKLAAMFNDFLKQKWAQRKNENLINVKYIFKVKQFKIRTPNVARYFCMYNKLDGCRCWIPFYFDSCFVWTTLSECCTCNVHDKCSEKDREKERERNRKGGKRHIPNVCVYEPLGP